MNDMGSFTNETSLILETSDIFQTPPICEDAIFRCTPADLNNIIKNCKLGMGKKVRVTKPGVWQSYFWLFLKTYLRYKFIEKKLLFNLHEALGNKTLVRSRLV